MTPSVIREGKLRSHIVLDAGLALALEDPNGENFGAAFNMVAHECAHVKITTVFDKAFPNFLLRKRHDNPHDALRWQIIGACWDEYAATWLSAPFGRDPAQWYEETFILALKQTRQKANDLIKAYRLHRDVNRVLAEVYGAYGELLKYAAYHLGNLAGRGLSPSQRPATTAALSGHWFAPYFARLAELCEDIAKSYARWSDFSKFEAIADLADEIVREGGMTISPLPGGRVHVHIPFTPETMPAA
jgi:hypothetical protein